MSRKSLYSLIQNSENPDMAQKFLSDYVYSIERKEDTYVPSKSFHPSSIKCIRNGVYQCLGIPKDIKNQSQTLFEICQNGTNTHASIQENVIDMGYDWQYENVEEYVKEKKLKLEIIEPSNFENKIYETKLYSKKYNVRFLCDGILSYTQRNKKEYFIFEIKTCGAGKFYGLTDVLDEHKSQAVCYSILLDIPRVLFMYSNRDMLNKKCFIYIPTEEEKKEMIKKLTYGNKCVKQKIIPPIPPDAGNKMCMYCNYRERCSEDKEKEIKLNEENI